MTLPRRRMSYCLCLYLIKLRYSEDGHCHIIYLLFAVAQAFNSFIVYLGVKNAEKFVSYRGKNARLPSFYAEYNARLPSFYAEYLYNARLPSFCWL
jgi:hypothetical protein